MWLKPVFCMLAVLCAFSARADELTPAKKDDIRKLIVITGNAKIAEQFAGAVTKNVTDMLTAARPDIPQRVFVVINQELTKLFKERMDAPDGLVDMTIPIYARYFSHAEIRELLTFYQSSIGQKAITALPNVMAESMAAGRKWGQSLGPEINRRVAATLKKEGIEMPRKQ